MSVIYYEHWSEVRGEYESIVLHRLPQPMTPAKLRALCVACIMQGKNAIYFFKPNPSMGKWYEIDPVSKLKTCYRVRKAIRALENCGATHYCFDSTYDDSAFIF